MPDHLVVYVTPSPAATQSQCFRRNIKWSMAHCTPKGVAQVVGDLRARGRSWADLVSCLITRSVSVSKASSIVGRAAALCVE